MSKLRPPQLGPIIGHTTSNSATVWIRGSAGNEGAQVDGSRRTIGVLAVISEDGKKLRSPKVFYFRLRREYDRTGIFVLGRDKGIKPPRATHAFSLKADTDYEIKVGTLHLDDPHPDSASVSQEELASRLPEASVWTKELEDLDDSMSLAQFKTFPESSEASEDISFILGSCRYPGLLWKKKHSDAIFGPLLEEAKGREGREPVKLALMVGDQIYADMFNRHIPIGLADTFEEFQERYHSAFGSNNMRELLSQIPTYMILDDHEIEDNWSQDRINQIKGRQVYNVAIEAYRSYQWIHGPRSYGDRLFYDFECSGYPFFVLDTRTQRFMDDVPNSLDDNHMLGRPALAEEEPSQLEFLLHWLKQAQAEVGNAPKFIVSSSVFAPNPVSARTGRECALLPDQEVKWKEASDSWPAFPKTREAILGCIVEHRIQNVIFLSGDIHCSNVAELEFSGVDGADQIKSFSIVSSAFYWPFPFADGDPSSFVHDSKDAEQSDTFKFEANGQSCAMDYKAWNFNQQDNFNRIDVSSDTNQIVVTTFDKKGQVIETGGWLGADRKELRSVLQLAPW